MVQSEASDFFRVCLHWVEDHRVWGEDVDGVVQRSIVLISEDGDVSHHGEVMEWERPEGLKLRKPDTAGLDLVKDLRWNVNLICWANGQVRVFIGKS